MVPPDGVLTVRFGSLSQTTVPPEVLAGSLRMYLYSTTAEPGSVTVPVHVASADFVSGTAFAGSQDPIEGAAPTTYTCCPGSSATCSVTLACTVAPASQPSEVDSQPSAGTVAMRLGRLS